MPVRIAVVGAGPHGPPPRREGRRARDAGGGVTFAGVADIDPDARAPRGRGERQRAPAAAAASSSAQADAAIVAVPTVAHFEVVRAALERGPATCWSRSRSPPARQQAEQLLALARRGGRVLQVGSQEWFNPALRAMRAKIQRPRFVEGHRVGPFSAARRRRRRGARSDDPRPRHPAAAARRGARAHRGGRRARRHRQGRHRQRAHRASPAAASRT